MVEADASVSVWMQDVDTLRQKKPTSSFASGTTESFGLASLRGTAENTMPDYRIISYHRATFEMTEMWEHRNSRTYEKTFVGGDARPHEGPAASPSESCSER